MNVILQSVVGSVAYGLDRPGSDIDRLGVYVAPTEDVLGLNPPTDGNSTVVQREPSDYTWHELGKFCRLALKVNPTITEILWMPQYEIRTSSGELLVESRRAFLSAPYVRSAYLGYATQQFHRIQVRESHDFSSDTKNRTSKHARHLLRLLDQGLQLWKTGELTVRVDNPDRYFAFGEEIEAGNVDLAKTALEVAEYEFNQTDPVVPDEPDTQIVDEAVKYIRKMFL